MIAVRLLSCELKADNFKRKCSKEFCILFFRIIVFFLLRKIDQFISIMKYLAGFYTVLSTLKGKVVTPLEIRKNHLMSLFTLLKQLNQQHLWHKGTSVLTLLFLSIFCF